MSGPGGHEEFDSLRKDLDGWRTRLDLLRVRAHLGRRELSDKLAELGEQLEPACENARERLARLARGGRDEVRTLARSLQAGWDALRRTHRELSREAREEGSTDEAARRG